MKQMLLTPHVSEKAVAEAANGVYLFNVPDEVNKQEIAASVAAQYDVTPVDVRVVRRKGKRIRTYRGRGKFANGQRSDSKKAYVRLSEGQSIPMFEEAK